MRATGSSAVLMLPSQATLFNGMLVITPLVALFKIICLALAFFTVIEPWRAKLASQAGDLGDRLRNNGGRAGRIS